MKKLMAKLEHLLELGGTKKDIALLVISGVSLVLSLTGVPLSFDAAWVAIVLCGVPIIAEAFIGLDYTRLAFPIAETVSGAVGLIMYAAVLRKWKNQPAESEKVQTAEKNIRRSDSARVAYYHNISGHAWGSRRNYDLMTDSSAGLDCCADMICSFVKARINQK